MAGWKRSLEWWVVHAVLPERLAYDDGGGVFDVDMSGVQSVEPKPEP